MKKTIFTIVLLTFASGSFANIIIVDQNGGGSFTTIQAAINAALTGDTVRVWPGTYNEQITLSSNILLEGSGYENTIITSGYNPTVIQSNGIIQWFMISSYGGDGIKITNNCIIRNCVIKSCSGSGIYANTGTSLIANCVIVNNGSSGIYEDNATINVTNCISYNNTGTGFNDCGYYCPGVINLSYSNGSTSNTSGNQGVINVNPNFLNGYQIPSGGACWDTGNPSLQDPDGSQSDMGYFGGPECPIYPVVYQITITPNGSLINLQAKGRANY